MVVNDDKICYRKSWYVSGSYISCPPVALCSCINFRNDMLVQQFAGIAIGAKCNMLNTLCVDFQPVRPTCAKIKNMK